jgi:hypothetical protein
MIIRARFNGPPATGNGGYSAGLFASQLTSSEMDGADDRDGDGAVEVTLRRPPPLETELTVLRSNPTRLMAGDQLVAEARPARVGDDEAVPAVPLATALEATTAYAGFRHHPFPTCYVCGPEREPGDGLRIFPGRLPDGRVAASFVAPDDISPTIVWAALDCPSGWAVPLEERPYVLGRIAVRIDRVPEPGDECVAVGLLAGLDGSRKANSRSTLYSKTGDRLAVARATWVALA